MKKNRGLQFFTSYLYEQPAGVNVDRKFSCSRSSPSVLYRRLPLAYCCGGGGRCCALAGKMADAFGDELFSVFEDDAASSSGLKETKGTPEAATSSKLG